MSEPFWEISRGATEGYNYSHLGEVRQLVAEHGGVIGISGNLKTKK